MPLGSKLGFDRVLRETAVQAKSLECLICIGRGKMGGIVNSSVSCDLANLWEEGTSRG